MKMRLFLFGALFLVDFSFFPDSLLFPVMFRITFKRQEIERKKNMKNFKLGLILSFIIAIGFNASAQELQIKEFFTHPPQIDILKYQYSQEQIAQLIEEDEIDPEDVYFEFNESYKSLVKYTTDLPCASEACKSLSIDERVSLYAYTVQYFGLINSILRGDNEADKAAIAPLTQGISQTLSKLEIFQGPLYRGIGDSKRLDRYQVGVTVIENSYTSTTSDKDSPYTKLGVLMRINSKKGRVLNELSGHPYEKEILFDKGTKFLVTGRAMVGEQLVIDLEEVD